MRINISPGALGTLLGTCGTGLAMALPEYKWIGWAVIALGIAVFVFQARVENGGITAHWPRREIMWPIIGMAVSALAFAIFGIWYLQARIANDIADVSFLVECFQSPLPTTIPEGGFVSVLPMRFDDKGSVGFGSQAGQVGDKMNWPEEWLKKWVGTTVRCQITNYANAPIFNINLPMTFTFKRIRSGNNPANFVADETINTVEVSLPITKLYPGKDSPFSFYIYNQGHDVVTIEFRDAPTFSFLNDRAVKKGHLIQPNDFTRFVSLWPFRDPKEIVGEHVPNTPK